MNYGCGQQFQIGMTLQVEFAHERVDMIFFDVEIHHFDLRSDEL